MTTKTGRILIAAPWLSLPLVLGSYAPFWERLPDTLAVQFDASGNVGNSMGKGASLAFDAAVLLFLLTKY